MAKERRNDEEENAGEVLRALDNPVRRCLMRLALDADETVVRPSEASKLLNVPLSNVSYHFLVLAKTRAVDAEERAAHDSVEHLYRANRAVAKMPKVAEALAEDGDD